MGMVQSARMVSGGGKPVSLGQPENVYDREIDMKQRRIPNKTMAAVFHAVMLCSFLAPLAFAGSFEPFLGVYLKEFDDELRKQLDCKGEGILIEEIIKNTGADKSDLQSKDIM
ncbi:MAG: hypothetical protein V3S89_03760, partial [Desulfobacterales bacterium]